MCNCEWQPISTAPKDGSDVLLFWGDSDLDISVGRWIAPKGFIEHWCKGGNWTPGDDPTHWMPLPAAPKPGESKEVAHE